MAGDGIPWSTEEKRAAVQSRNFAEFHAQFPDRGRDAWRIKRHRVSTGKSPMTGDRRRDRYIGAAAQNAPTPARARHPHGWEPGIEWKGTEGVVTTGPVERDPRWDEVLGVWGLDPEKFEVIEPVQYRAWDANVGNGEIKRMFYYRANVRERRQGAREDIDGLIAEIAAHVPAPRRVETDDRALIVSLSDWQLGKRGTDGTVERIEAMIDGIAEQLMSGRFDQLVVLGLGDLVEQCGEFYEMQTFEVEMHRRDQVKVTRRLIVLALTTWSPLVPTIVVAAIGGNHGENRRNGKAYTSFGDNDDVSVFEMAAEVLAANPAYANVSFYLPHDALTLTIDVKGVILGLAHGHQVKGTVEAWWKAQTFGRRPLADADLLFTGHRHHLEVHQHGSRTHFQAPTLDSGSPWFEETVGTPSVAGTMTVELSEGRWSRLDIL